MELKDRQEEELAKLAEKYGIDKRLKGDKRIEAIEKAEIKLKLRYEAEARAELAKEAEEKMKAMGFAPGRKKPKPSPETIAIYGGTDPNGRKVEPSKKFYYVWTNLEDQGQTQAATVGGKFYVKLYDGKIHCLPEFVVDLWQRRCIAPLYSNRKNPVTGLEESVWVGNRPRWSFRKLEEAPANAEFGVVLDKALEKRHNLEPVPA